MPASPIGEDDEPGALVVRVMAQRHVPFRLKIRDQFPHRLLGHSGPLSQGGETRAMAIEMGKERSVSHTDVCVSTLMQTMGDLAFESPERPPQEPPDVLGLSRVHDSGHLLTNS